MTKQQHPITPPPELVDKWLTEPEYGSPGLTTLHTLSKPRLTQMFTRAAQWGADQELELCCEWLTVNDYDFIPLDLHAARRPKPPSLKQQALTILEDTDLPAARYNILLRALEALPND